MLGHTTTVRVYGHYLYSQYAFFFHYFWSSYFTGVRLSGIFCQQLYRYNFIVPLSQSSLHQESLQCYFWWCWRERA